MENRFAVPALACGADADPRIAPAAVEVLKQFRLIFGAVRQHFREAEEHCGFSGSQVWILREAGQAPGMGVTALAQRLGIHQSTCSILVEKLVSRGLLTKQRSQADQRRVGLYLTVPGEAVLDRHPGPAEGLLPEALNALPVVALKTLSASLNELIGKLHRCEAHYGAMPLADIVGGSGEGPPTREGDA